MSSTLNIFDSGAQSSGNGALVFFDTETTGLDHTRDSIIEVACVKVLDLNCVDHEIIFHKYINTDAEITEDSFKVHGISKEFLQDKPKFPEICKDLLDFIGNATIIAHNAQFDMNFLNAELGRLGLKQMQNEVIDSLLVAKRLYPGSPVGIDALMRRFGMATRGYHSALEDAKILARIYSCMHAPKQDGLFGVMQSTGLSGEFSMCKKIIT